MEANEGSMSIIFFSKLEKSCQSDFIFILEPRTLMMELPLNVLYLFKHSKSPLLNNGHKTTLKRA